MPTTGNNAAYPMSSNPNDEVQIGFTKREVIAKNLMASLVEKINMDTYSSITEALEVAADTAIEATDILLAKLEQ